MDLYTGLPILSACLGHRSLSSTEKYVRLTCMMYPEFEKQCSPINAFVYPKITTDYDYQDWFCKISNEIFYLNICHINEMWAKTQLLLIVILSYNSSIIWKISMEYPLNDFYWNILHGIMSSIIYNGFTILKRILQQHVIIDLLQSGHSVRISNI